MPLRVMALPLKDMSPKLIKERIGMKTRRGKILLLSGLLPALVFGASYSVTPGESLAVVRDRIRADRKAGKIAVDEKVSVIFVPGEHVCLSTLELDARDSGSEDARVEWRVEKPGSVRMLGGMRIPRTAFRPVTDEKTLARLPLAAHGKVFICEAAKYLVKDHPVWPDHPKGVMPGPWLYCNGMPQTVARWPNKVGENGGWTTYTNVLEHCGWQADLRAKAPATMEFPNDRITRWHLDEGVWLTGFFGADWYCDTLRLGSYDPKTRGAKFAAISSFGISKSGWEKGRRRFFAQNLLDELDEPGEWYFDLRTKRIYWYPPTDSTDEDEIMLAQAVTPFIRGDGLAWTDFCGFSFEVSHGDAAVVLTNCVNCRVLESTFFNHAGEAVRLHGRDNLLADSEIRNIGATAVRLTGGDRRWLLPANNAMVRCRIERYAIYQRSFSSGIEVRGCGNAVRDCLVTNSPYIAINYKGNEHLFADNEFCHVVLDTLDSGAIYTGHNASELGTVFFGNYIHDLARTEEECQLRTGIYFDDCDWGDDVIGNRFARTGMAVLIGGGKLHGIFNNIMEECRYGISCDSRGYDWRTGARSSFAWDRRGHSFVRYRCEGMDVLYAPWHVVYPALEEAMDNRPEYPTMNEMRGNVFVRCVKPFDFTGATPYLLGKEPAGNTITDTMPEKPIQPVTLKEAAVNELVSADQSTVARFFLDVSGHLVWDLKVDRHRVLEPSPLGVTVGYRDYGRKSVPDAAKEILVSAETKPWTEGTALRQSYPGCWRNDKRTVETGPWREWTIPIRDLVTGTTDAFLDIRLWKGGAAYRWRVPGIGERKVYGENNAFLGLASEYEVVECERPKTVPESFLYPRGGGLGVSFPEYPRGWKHDGELITGWRVIVKK